MKLFNSFGILNSLRVTPNEIKKETRKKFRLAVAGSADMVNVFCEVLTAGANLEPAGTEKPPEVSDFVTMLPLPIDETTRRELKSDALIFLLNRQDSHRDSLLRYRDMFKLNPPAHLFMEEPETLEDKERLYQILDDLFISGAEWIEPLSAESVAAKGETILSINSRIDVALAYRFPILREAMAEKSIHKTGIQNMIVALASSLPANLPIVGIIIGLLGAAGETTVLTMNQLKLCMQLAGIYGLDLNLMDRIKELWPLVGSAMGFRAISRTLVGFIPIAGPGFKGSIAYAGTYLVGQTARWYYEHGRRLTADEKRRIYKKALDRAKTTAEDYLAKIKSSIKDGTKGREIVDIDQLGQEFEMLKDELNHMEDDAPEKVSSEDMVSRARHFVESMEEERLISDTQKEESEEKAVAESTAGKAGNGGKKAGSAKKADKTDEKSEEKK